MFFSPTKFLLANEVRALPPGDCFIMPHLVTAFALVFSICSTPFAVRAEGTDNDAQLAATRTEDWPWWRGPNRNGVANPNQKPPLSWSDTENVLWKTPVPGRGHGSPIIVGNQVFLPTADHKEQTQSVLCFDRGTGQLLWQTVVHKAGLENGGNAKASMASSTLACDGQRVVATFVNKKAIYATALDLGGNQLWQSKVTDYVLHQGFGSSPTIYKGLVIVGADNKSKGVIAALDAQTGALVWQQPRPKLPNYASPIIYSLAGKDQLLFTGCKLVTSLDPLTGTKLWEIDGSTEETVTSTVTDGKLIIISGGYPKQHLAAVHADGSGKIAWEVKTQVYVPSMLYREGHLYGVLDGGMAVCWKFGTGKEVWKSRLGGSFTASPVLVGDHIFATNEAGRTFIFKANPKAFDLIAENQLADEVLATPAIVGSRIFMRAAVKMNGQRQEMLYSLGARAH
jgi:outer membrane protein assembly factor BamB